MGWVDEAGSADVRIGATENGELVQEIVLAVAAPFATVVDGISESQVLALGAGNGSVLSALFGEAQIGVVSETVYALLSSIAAAYAKLRILPGARLSSEALAGGGRLAIVPFNELQPHWKLLHVDGINLFDRNADLSRYPLIVRLRAQGDPALIKLLPRLTNRDTSRLAIVAMTGVTALVRGTAQRMAAKGLTYPAAKIRDWLTSLEMWVMSAEVSQSRIFAAG